MLLAAFVAPTSPIRAKLHYVKYVRLSTLPNPS